MNADPLLTSYRLKHLTLRNRLMSTANGAFELYRIDAVASRNVHAAVYDALRLAKDF